MRPEKRWAKTDPGLRSHPAFIDLVAELESTPILVDGMLHGLWSVAFFDAPDGDLSRFKPRALARAVGWPVPGKSPGHGGTSPDVLVQSLVDTGFLYRDGDRLLIHDWEDWGGALFTERRYETEKKAHQRKPVDNEPDVPGKSPGHPAVSPGLSRVDRDRDKEGEKDPKDPLAENDDFATWWTTYGSVGSKADAEALYLHWRRHGADVADLLAAAVAYRDHCAATDCKMMHGRTFLAKKLNRWHEWAAGEHHGAMDVRADRNLTDVLTAGARAFGLTGDDHEHARIESGFGNRPAGAVAGRSDARRGVPAGELAAGE